MNFHDQEIERNPLRWVPFFICLGVARGKNRKGSQATIPLPLRSAEIFLEPQPSGSKSCRSSQSDHSITSAIVRFFDLQWQGTVPMIHEPESRETWGTEKGCKDRETLKRCRVSHLQIKIGQR